MIDKGVLRSVIRVLRDMAEAQADLSEKCAAEASQEYYGGASIGYSVAASLLETIVVYGGANDQAR